MCYSNCTYMHGYYRCVSYYFINFTFAPFFSLSSSCTTNSVTSPLLIFFFLKHTQTHPHTNKIAIEIHKHTHTDKPIERQIDASVDRLWINGSVLVALDQSSWVNGNGSGCLWISVGGKDRCLWVGCKYSLHVHLLLWVGTCGRNDA